MARTKTKTQNNTTQGENNMSSMFTPITDEAQAADILAGAAGRGDYRTILEAFIQAGVRIAEVTLNEGLLEGRTNAQTVKTGFDNVKSSKKPLEGADQIKVVKKDERVYLVNGAVSAG